VDERRGLQAPPSCQAMETCRQSTSTTTQPRRSIPKFGQQCRHAWKNILAILPARMPTAQVSRVRSTNVFVACRPNAEKIPKVAFTFTHSNLLLYWALMPEEGLAMCVEQNGTFWDTKRGTLHACRVRMSQNVTECHTEKRCQRRRVAIRTLACPIMSPNVAVPKRSFWIVFWQPRWRFGLEGCPRMSANVRAGKKNEVNP